MKLISLPAKKNIKKAEGGPGPGLKKDKNLFIKVFNIILKLFKALLVNRLQVQGGANRKSQPGRLLKSFPKRKKHFFRAGMTKSDNFLIMSKRPRDIVI